jgi:arylsulfatase A-like enzyme
MPRKSSPKPSLIAAGYCGITAWLTYGVIELTGIAILPWFLKAGYEYKAYDAGFNGLLLLLYVLIGAAIGIFSGLAIRFIPVWNAENSSRVLQALNSLALTAVLLANLLILLRDWVGAPIILVVNLILVILANLLCTGSGDLARRCRPFSSAWLPAGVYLISLSLGEWTPARASLYMALASAGLWTLAWFGGKFAGEREGAPGRSLAVVAVLGIVACGVSALLHASPYLDPGGAVTAASAAGRPNVILISLDTVRADHLSVYGYARKTTPNLEQFARESEVFTRAVSSGDMTLPTHASFFTGLYPSQHGAHFSKEQRLGVPLDSRYDTLSGLLRDSGYWTGGVVANGGYLSIAFGLNRGFTYWDQRLPAVKLAPLSAAYLRGRIRNLVVRFVPTSEWDRVARGAEEINQAVYSALDQRPGGRPFFLFVNYMDAHIPYIPPAAFRDRFPGRDAAFTESRYIATYLDVVGHDRPIGEKERAHLVSQYDAGIAYLDANLGALFAHLKSAGLWEDSLVIVTSDHGEALGEHNQLDHGGLSLYEDQIHVPLLVKYPGAGRKGSIDQPAASVDIMPTVLTAARLPVPEYLAGENLAGPLGKDREVLAESFPGGRAYFTNMTRFDRTLRGIVSAARKYVAPSSGSPELYDLRQDPDETKNLYDPNQETSREAAERLSAWSRAVLAASRGGGPGVRVPGKIDRETVDRLKSLGYVSR